MGYYIETNIDFDNIVEDKIKYFDHWKWPIEMIKENLNMERRLKFITFSEYKELCEHYNIEIIY